MVQWIWTWVIKKPIVFFGSESSPGSWILFSQSNCIYNVVNHDFVLHWNGPSVSHMLVWNFLLYQKNALSLTTFFFSLFRAFPHSSCHEPHLLCFDQPQAASSILLSRYPVLSHITCQSSHIMSQETKETLSVKHTVTDIDICMYTYG